MFEKVQWTYLILFFLFWYLLVHAFWNTLKRETNKILFTERFKKKLQKILSFKSNNKSLHPKNRP